MSEKRTAHGQSHERHTLDDVDDRLRFLPVVAPGSSSNSGSASEYDLTVHRRGGRICLRVADRSSSLSSSSLMRLLQKFGSPLISATWNWLCRSSPAWSCSVDRSRVDPAALSTLNYNERATRARNEPALASALARMSSRSISSNDEHALLPLNSSSAYRARARGRQMQLIDIIQPTLHPRPRSRTPNLIMFEISSLSKTLDEARAAEFGLRNSSPDASMRPITRWSSTILRLARSKISSSAKGGAYMCVSRHCCNLFADERPRTDSGLGDQTINIYSVLLADTMRPGDCLYVVLRVPV